MATKNFEQELIKLISNIVRNGLRTRPTATTVNVSLASITDVNLSGVTSGNFLRYDGSTWVNTDLIAADLPTAIDAANIADGSVSNTEFQYLNGVTSAIQTQIDGKISDSSTDTLTNKTINTASNTITIVEADISDLGSYITSSSTDTLTNKTFDANGTGNSLSNVDVADLATGTDGELITWDASGNPTTVAVGTSGHVLTSNGAGAAPTFQAPSGGGGGDYELIASATASASSTIEFTGLSSSYHMYKLVMTSIVPSTDPTDIILRTSTNNGSSYDSGASDYGWSNMLLGYPGTEAYLNDDFDSQIELFTGQGGNTNEQLSIEITIFNPSDTVYTAFSWDGIAVGGSGTRYTIQGGGERRSAADVDAIQISTASGNITSGEFRLYGINNS